MKEGSAFFLERKKQRTFVLALLIGTVLIGKAVAQSTYDQSPAARALGGASQPGGSGPPGGASGFGPRESQGTQSSPDGPMPELKPTIAPRQRLDVGALLCHTHAQLSQHQAAVMARIAGRQAPEPGGCHIVGQTQAVTVLIRDGQAATEVQFAGETLVTGWTDAVIRDSDPLHGPMK